MGSPKPDVGQGSIIGAKTSELQERQGRSKGEYIQEMREVKSFMRDIILSCMQSATKVTNPTPPQADPSHETKCVYFKERP